MKNKALNQTKFLLINYVLAPTLGVCVCLLEAFGRIKCLHFERFPIWEEKLIVVSNHPSLLEPIILPLMWFPWMNFPLVFSPVWSRIKFSSTWFKELQKEFSLPKKLIPTNVPDRNNFYDPTYMTLLQTINIPVDRNGGAQGRIRTILALKNILEEGGRILIFPEGTRTFKAIEKGRLTSANGKQLGKLKEGAAWLALKTNAKILPIWVEGTDKVLPNNRLPLPRLWRRMIIKIGSPFQIQRDTREGVTSEIAETLLQLADEK